MTSLSNGLLSNIKVVEGMGRFWESWVLVETGGDREKQNRTRLIKISYGWKKKGETSVDNFGILCNVGKVGF